MDARAIPEHPDLAVRTFRPTPDQYAWTFGGVDPVHTVRPGEVLELYTEDCFAGRIRGVGDLPATSIEYPFINPQTGPFFVEGAEQGDTLAIHLVDVAPARDWAVSTSVSLFGSLTPTRITASLQEPLPERTWFYHVLAEEQAVLFQAIDSDFEMRLPLQPFHGTIGVAPAAFEARNVLVPDYFGGNMDSPEVRAGTTIYLGVNVPGALFSLGDGHYTMGEGETCGAAVEGAMNTVLVVEVIKRTYCEWPRLESDEAIMVAGSCRPLEDAFRISHAQVVRWVAAALGLSLMDAYQLVSQAARSRIANVVDPNYTIVAKVPKRFLPSDVTWMSGAHERLRSIGREYLAAMQRTPLWSPG
ncbi:MAG: acetamidase/formamidase family protein [Candidatus Dormiibacterota bacterium]|jgi:acetamidase/formamidase